MSTIVLMLAVSLLVKIVAPLAMLTRVLIHQCLSRRDMYCPIHIISETRRRRGLYGDL